MKVLAGVFNPIAYDGRVQRAAEALAGIAEVTIVCPAGPPIAAAVPLSVVPVRLPGNGFIADYVTFVRAFISFARRHRPDVIHGHDYFLALPGLIASRLTGARFVYDAHELIIPEEGRPRKPLLRVFGAAERIAVLRADLVIAANRERADRMAAFYGLAAEPLVVQNIPPAQPEWNRAATPLPVRAEGWRPDDTVFVYQGHLKLQRGLSRILAALAQLPDNIRMVVVGSGPDAARLKDEVQARGLGARVHLPGRVSRTDLPAILAQCDVGILTYSYATLNDRLCAPNKVFEYAQAGLPVLATDQVPLRRFVEGYGIGSLIAEEDGPEQIAATMLAMASRNREDYADAISRFLAEHSWEDEASALRVGVQALYVYDRSSRGSGRDA